jgi:hypothetical protein
LQTARQPAVASPLRSKAIRTDGPTNIIDLTNDSDEDDSNSAVCKESHASAKSSAFGGPSGSPSISDRKPERLSPDRQSPGATPRTAPKLTAIRAILRRKTQETASSPSPGHEDGPGKAAIEQSSSIVPPRPSTLFPSAAPPPTTNISEAPITETVVASVSEILTQIEVPPSPPHASHPEDNPLIAQDGADEQECQDMLAIGQASDLEVSYGPYLVSSHNSSVPQVSEGEYDPMPISSQSVSRSPSLPSGFSSSVSLDLLPERIDSTSLLSSAMSGTMWTTWSDYRLDALKAIPKPLLAKDLPHSLQDDINSWPKEFRSLPHTRIVFEQMIIENTMDDEVDAPNIKIYNNVDDEPTPPWEFHYTNQRWFGEGVPAPDLSMLVGCDCVGPCDPRSKTCSCVKRQRHHTKQWTRSGFLYNDDGTLKIQV